MAYLVVLWFRCLHLLGQHFIDLGFGVCCSRLLVRDFLDAFFFALIWNFFVGRAYFFRFSRSLLLRFLDILMYSLSKFPCCTFSSCCIIFLVQYCHLLIPHFFWSCTCPFLLCTCRVSGIPGRFHSLSVSCAVSIHVYKCVFLLKKTLLEIRQVVLFQCFLTKSALLNSTQFYHISLKSMRNNLSSTDQIYERLESTLNENK